MFGLTTQEANVKRINDLYIYQDKNGVSFIEKLVEAIKDEGMRILYLLIIAEVLNFLIGKYMLGMGNNEIYSLIMTILIGFIIIFSSAWLNYKQEKGLAELKKEGIIKAKVYRDGELTEVPINEIVVDDCILLQPGDKIPADGFLVKGRIKVNQSALNGCNDEIEKFFISENVIMIHDEEMDLSSELKCFQESIVISGTAVMQVSAIGIDTLVGKRNISEKRDIISLADEKNKNLIKEITKMAYYAAIIIFIRNMYLGIHTAGNELETGLYLYILLNSVMLGVSILLMAIPEGLLVIGNMIQGMNVKKMRKDNIYVKNPKAIENAGYITKIFTNKTGILTNGNLSVDNIIIATGEVFDEFYEIPKTIRKMLITGIGINNDAEISGDEVIGSNQIDRALLKYIAIDNEVEIDKSIVESSGTFEMFARYTYIRLDRGTIYIKGDPDVILEDCMSYINSNGFLSPFDENQKENIYKILKNERARGRKVIAVAKSFRKTNTLIALISIKDDTHKYIKKTIVKLRKAGISVAIVTGDDLLTAKAVAENAGLTLEGNICLTHSELAKLSDKQLMEILPHIKIVAGANASDKERLIRISQKIGEIIGFVGNNISDVSIMNKADVSFSIQSATEYAKEKADIIILDDSISTIADTIKYGRATSKTVKKFSSFQLTVACSAVFTAIIGAFIDGVGEIFNVIQALWMNMVMDILAAIAFGQEPAQEKYMLDNPIPRKDGIINNYVISAVAVGGGFITVVSLLILTNAFGIQQHIIGSVDVGVVRTFMFATFMFLVIFNSLNSRTNSLNLFSHINQNKNFILVMTMITIVQVCIIQLGGEVFETTPLSKEQWIYVILIAFMIIPIDLIRKVIFKSLDKT